MISTTSGLHDFRNATAELESTKVPQIPDEILSMIIDACTPKFKLTTQPWNRTDESPEDNRVRVAIVGFPDLKYLTLVNRGFRDQVWSAICANFDGRLELEDELESNMSQYAVIRRVNDLFAGLLRRLAPRVTTIRDWLIESDASRELRLDLFPGLREMQFATDCDREEDKSLCDFSHFRPRENMRNEGLKNEVLGYVAEQLLKNPLMPEFLNSLRIKGVRIIVVYDFESSLGGWVAIYYVEITDPENMSVVRRVHRPYDSHAEYSGDERSENGYA